MLTQPADEISEAEASVVNTFLLLCQQVVERTAGYSGSDMRDLIQVPICCQARHTQRLAMHILLPSSAVAPLRFCIDSCKQMTAEADPMPLTCEPEYCQFSVSKSFQNMSCVAQEACSGPLRDAARSRGAAFAELMPEDLRPVVLRDFRVRKPLRCHLDLESRPRTPALWRCLCRAEAGEPRRGEGGAAGKCTHEATPTAASVPYGID